MISIQGYWFDGKSSTKNRAELFVDRAGRVSVVTAENGGPISLREYFYDAEIRPRLADTPRYISFSDGKAFETRDHDKVDALLERHRPSAFRGLVNKFEARIYFVIPGILVLVLTGWLVIQHGIPALSQFIAGALPHKVEEVMGKSVMDLIDAQYFQATELNRARIERLRQAFAPLTRLENRQRPVSIHFRKSEVLGANAFALPSGIIILTDDIVELAENDNELIAILAHEAGHIKHRHGLRAAIQDSLLVFLIAFMTGDISSTSSAFLAVPALLLQAGYSREFEREADRCAFELLQELNIAPVHFSNVMYRLERWRAEQRVKSDGMQNGTNTDLAERTEKILAYFSTHPETRERVRLFGEPNLDREEGRRW